MPYQAKTCAMCAVTFTPTGSVQKVCESCKPEFRRQRNIEHLRALRLRQGATPIGTIRSCLDCAVEFAYRSGPQKRCDECQRKAEIGKIHAWLASDKERLAKYRKASKDNYNFGGNRDKALERDGYRCQHCSTDQSLEVHHIDGRGTTTPKELRNHALENLLTLCTSCHAKEHARMRHSS